jgi:hypothetical protein
MSLQMWKHIVAKGLTLNVGERREFQVHKAAVLKIGRQPEAVYYSVVIRSSKDPDRIYDLAFALSAFTMPLNVFTPKQYRFLYLYCARARFRNRKLTANFYPAKFVSDVIGFDTRHTMFRRTRRSRSRIR